MADHTSINNIYNYYLTTYAQKSDTKFDTHKKSELRGVYNSIVKMNKEAPLFIVDKSQETKEYAVGLKENARALHNTIASLGGLKDEDLLSKKVAFSSDDSLASVNYIGDEADKDKVPSFEISVQRLAGPQINAGRMIPTDAANLPVDTYSFDIGINGLNYEFQYNVSEGDTNGAVQEKLARLISNSGIGLDATVEHDGNGNSALVIKSQNVGASETGRLFTVSDEHTSKTSGSVGFFGLDNIIKEAQNSQFTINGNPHEASGNSFTVEKLYEVTLNRVSRDENDSAAIDLKADIESMAANISKLVDGYNGFISSTDSYMEHHPKSGRLVREMYGLASLHEEDLNRAGLTLKEDGRIELDRGKLMEAVYKEDFNESIDGIKAFAGSVLRKANQVSLNPMHYADRTIVAYKNPGHNYASPYVTSAYTGMMFNSYC
ncbi:MAG: hypothetical protein J5487_06235 [Lachnospiraceae bacterium]|nr:hypothetical protein [Lachnospiraceae bacterium]